MSTDAGDEGGDMCCASCGVAEVGKRQSIEEMHCLQTRSILQCVECQRNHRPRHKKTCKQRTAELRDVILFKQPESRSQYGDLPHLLFAATS